MLADAGALLAFEGNNEPNNWGVTYQGETGGGRAPSWMAVARLQRDLYQAVKSDPVLAAYPVWSISEPGAERDDVGLQYLAIPSGAKTLMPDGTTYADTANVHNYIYHPHSRYPADNKTWDAADPTAASRVDGLFGNFGVTWARRFRGYSQDQLDTLPRVTTETGARIEGPVTEELHGAASDEHLSRAVRARLCLHLGLSAARPHRRRRQPGLRLLQAGLFTAQGRDVSAQPDDHSGGQGRLGQPGSARLHAFADQPTTVHDLLLQHSDGTFQLIVWDERLSGQDRVTIKLGVTPASVRIYDPTIGVEPVQTLTNAGVLELTLSDHPVVIAISPN